MVYNNLFPENSIIATVECALVVRIIFRLFRMFYAYNPSGQGGSGYSASLIRKFFDLAERRKWVVLAAGSGARDHTEYQHDQLYSSYKVPLATGEAEGQGHSPLRQVQVKVSCFDSSYTCSDQNSALTQIH